MDEYLVGNPVRIFIDNIHPDDDPVQDPSTIALLIRHPDGTVDTRTAADLTHDGVGAYSWQQNTAPGDEGTWAWRFEITGPYMASEGVFEVFASAVAGPDADWPTTGPCHEWTDRDEISRLPGADIDGIDAGLVDRCISAASDIMFQLGGRRWPGLCDRTVIVGGCSAEWLLPLPFGGDVAWRAYAPRPHDPMMCTGGRAVPLAGPVTSISEVRLDGVVLASSAYEVREWSWLVRTDGGVWPCAHRWFETPPPMEVDYTFGDAPPAIGRLGATVLALELIRSQPGATGECRLDRRVKSTIREGVSIDFAIPGLVESLAQGNTGIPEVDLFVHAHNPNRLTRRARFVNL